MPFTVVFIFGLALLLAIIIYLNIENHFMSLMFILISVLMLPHMLIVEQMYEEKS